MRSGEMDVGNKNYANSIRAISFRLQNGSNDVNIGFQVP